MSGQLHGPAALPPFGTHSIGGWVSLRAGLDDVERRKLSFLPRLELRPFWHPARSHPLYRLRYFAPSNSQRFCQIQPRLGLYFLTSIFSRLVGEYLEASVSSKPLTLSPHSLQTKGMTVTHIKEREKRKKKQKKYKNP
jgi:hypothetical protein